MKPKILEAYLQCLMLNHSWKFSNDENFPVPMNPASIGGIHKWRHTNLGFSKNPSPSSTNVLLVAFINDATSGRGTFGDTRAKGLQVCDLGAQKKAKIGWCQLQIVHNLFFSFFNSCLFLHLDKIKAKKVGIPKSNAGCYWTNLSFPYWTI